METTTLNNDITVMYVTATSYPEGIMQAHGKLHSLVPFSEERTYFGLSRPEQGEGIVYRAAVGELHPGEASEYGLETLAIKKGNYACITINNYMQNMPAITQAFKQLLAHPNLDPQGYCVEWYLTKEDVKCMVRLV